VLLQPKLKGDYLYYSKRGPGDDYWNMYRIPLQQQQKQQQMQQGMYRTAATGPAGQPASLAEAVQSAAEAVQSAAATASTTAASSPSSSGVQQQSILQASNKEQQQHSATSEQLVLDENSLSAGHTYWDVYEKEVSPDGSRIAFTYDTVGDECYSLQVGGLLHLFEAYVNDW
jgi:protease II